MPEERGDALRETLVGTWFAVALIVELLIASEVAEFENRARPEGRTALSAIRKIISSPDAPVTLPAVRCRRFRSPAETA